MAIVTSSGAKTAPSCFEMLRASLNRAGTPLDADVVRHDLHGSDEAAGALAELLTLREPPTAFFASQVFVTTGAIKALRQLGRHEDIARVGFDDIALADVLGLRLVLQDVQAIGGLAAEVLFRRLDGDDSPIQRHVIPTRLVTRGSGEIPGPFR